MGRGSPICRNPSLQSVEYYYIILLHTRPFTNWNIWSIMKWKIGQRVTTLLQSEKNGTIFLSQTSSNSLPQFPMASWQTKRGCYMALSQLFGDMSLPLNSGFFNLWIKNGFVRFTTRCIKNTAKIRLMCSLVSLPQMYEHFSKLGT